MAMPEKEAAARIKINKLLEAAGWRFFQEGNAPANIRLEPAVTVKTTDLDALGDNFEATSKGFVDFLLLDARGFPLIVLEAKAEDKNPLVGKEQARKYARSQNCRFVILSNGNLHYFWDLERGNPYVITSFPTPESVIGYLRALRSQQATADLQPTCGLIVPKEEIALNGDCNLSGERYREGVIAVSSWPFVPVGDAFRKGNQSVLPESLDNPVTYVGLENITQNTGEIDGNFVTENPADIKSLKNVFKPCDILYGKLRPNLNKVWLADREGICSTDIFVI